MLRILFSLFLLTAFSTTWVAPAVAQFIDEPKPEEQATAAERLGEARKQRLQVGVIVKAIGGPCNGIFATTPIPMDWPEQKVTIVEEDFSREVGKVSYRLIDGTVKQMEVVIPRIANGQEVRAIVTLEIERHAINAPPVTDGLKPPTRMDRQMRGYLASSPKIEVRAGKIREVARQLAVESKDKTSWQQIEHYYDWVRENVEYKKGPLKGGLAALLDGTGDCEELTSLFIAICRANEIPARTVWIPGHCYPEFYLEYAPGKGYWFPCQAAGSRAFGSMPEYRAILQKGDNFKVADKRDRQRYVSEFLKGNATRGGGKPDVNFVREVLPN